jgi:hypothetical protein
MLLMPLSASAQTSSSSDTAEDAIDEDPHASRLVFSNTARPLGADEVYVSLSSIVVPQLGYGVTDWLGVEIGGQFIPEINPKLFYIDPIAQVWQRDELHVAVGSRLSMVRGRQYGVGTRSRILATSDPLVLDESWDAHWQPEVLATVAGSRGALTGGVGLHVSTTASDLGGSYLESAYLKVGAELQLLSWMRFISESEVHGGYTDRVLAQVRTPDGDLSTQFIESTGAYLQSANALRLHGDHFATELGIGVQALTDPVISTNDTSLFGILRFTYQF